jgi:hypothetical protein
MAKKKEMSINDLAVMINGGFSDMQSQINRLEVKFDGTQNRIGDLSKTQGSIKQDMIWIKDILEKHTMILQRLDEERIFTLNYVQRLEKEINIIKKRLKIA